MLSGNGAGPKAEEAAGASRTVALAALLVPVLLLAQFLLAGLALYGDTGLWGVHGAVGGTAAIPILVVLAGALRGGRNRHLRWWAGLQALLYVSQIGWVVADEASGLGWAMAMHPLNGALLLTAALTILAKVLRAPERTAQP